MRASCHQPSLLTGTDSPLHAPSVNQLANPHPVALLPDRRRYRRSLSFRHALLRFPPLQQILPPRPAPAPAPLTGAPCLGVSFCILTSGHL